MASDDNGSYRDSSSSRHSHNHSSSSSYCDGDDIVHRHRRHSGGHHHKRSGSSVTPNNPGPIETAELVRTVTHFAITAALVAVLGAMAYSFARENRELRKASRIINDRNNILLENERNLKAEIESLKKKCEELNQENNKLVERQNAIPVQ